jgi:hypothetical protein
LATSITFLGVGILVVHLTEVGGHLVAVLELRVLLEAGVERGVAAHHQRRHGLGHLVAHRVGVAQHPGRIAHRGPGLDGGEGDDLGDVVAAVALGRVADHLVAVARVEVHVDVGHRDAARVEEALEQQVVLDRVEIGDPQRVGHGTAGGRPTARPHPDVVVLGACLMRSQVMRKYEANPMSLDDLQLVGQALDHGVGQRSPQRRLAPSKVRWSR